MSIPSYPTIYISPEDKANFKKSKVSSESSVVIDSNFNTLFLINSNTVKRTGNIVQLSLTLGKYNGHMLLNTTAVVGTIPMGFRPSSAISGTFPYILFIGDIGAINITANGIVSIRSGDNAYIADTTVFTVSIIYITT
jgi:hypothetical protein